MSTHQITSHPMPAGIADMFAYVESEDRGQLPNAMARKMVRDAVSGKAKAHKDASGAVVVVHNGLPTETAR